MLYRLAIAGMMFVTMGMVATQTVHDESFEAQRLNAMAGNPRACSLRESGCYEAPMQMPAPELPPMPGAVVAGTTIVNVAGGLVAYDATSLIRVSIGEHVHAVDGELVTDGTARDRIEASLRGMTPGRPIVDVTIDGPQSERRVLVFANYAQD